MNPLSAPVLGPPRRAFRQWAPPLALAIVMVALLASVIGLARRAGAPDAPPQPGAFAAPPPSGPTVAYDVQQAAAGRLTLGNASGPQAFRAPKEARNLALPGTLAVEILAADTVDHVKEGDWLNVIGVVNGVRSFSIRAVVVIHDPAQPGEDGFVRSPAGFVGHEASRDQEERPLFGGRVESVDGQAVTLTAPTGPVTVTLTERAPLYGFASSTAGEIPDGARVAFRLGAQPVLEAAEAVLVLPGAASK